MPVTSTLAQEEVFTPAGKVCRSSIRRCRVKRTIMLRRLKAEKHEFCFSIFYYEDLMNGR